MSGKMVRFIESKITLNKCVLILCFLVEWHGHDHRSYWFWEKQDLAVPGFFLLKVFRELSFFFASFKEGILIILMLMKLFDEPLSLLKIAHWI